MMVDEIKPNQPQPAEAPAKEIGSGTPLHEELHNPLIVPESDHQQVLSVGPGTPLNEDPEPAWESQAPVKPVPVQAGSAPVVSSAAVPAVAPATPVVSAVPPEDSAVMEDADINFADELEQSLGSEPALGEVVTGQVIRIDAEGVVVDVGYKSEGIIAREEFIDARGQTTVQVGDTVDVLLERRENKEGLLVLSKRKVDRFKAWDAARISLATGSPVEGTLAAKCKGGFMVDLGGAQAFMPGSQLDVRPVGNPDSLIGQKMKFKVIKLNKERGNIVVSRRAFLLEERDKQKSEVFSRLAPGRLVSGVVKNLTNYGAFVDLGGMDGLLHVNDMAWSKVTNPRQIVKPGDTIEVLILSMDEATGKIALGLKQKSEDPWINLAAKYPVGSLAQGEVVSLTDFGAFLRLETGVEGLLPVSEMSWTRRVRHPKEILNVGDTVSVKVLSLDPQAKKISLGLKQTEPEPFGVFTSQHKPGDVVEGVVKSLTSYGAFVEIAEGVTGLLHVGDLSWDATVKSPAGLLQVDDRIQVKILDVQPDKKKIALGLKQLQEDPWVQASRHYALGKVVPVKVLRNTKFGVFVQLEPGVEGLIHVSQMEKGKGNEEYTPLPEGETIEAKIVKVNRAEHKIGLSIREALHDRESEEIQKYLSPSNKPGISFGEISGISMEELLKRVNHQQE